MNAFDCGRAGNAVSQLGHRKRWSVGDTTHVPRYDITETTFTQKYITQTQQPPIKNEITILKNKIRKMNTGLTKKAMSLFESIKHIDKDGVEYWTSRALWKVLEYTEYRHVLPVVEKAKLACRNSGQRVEDHFEDILEMVGLAREAPCQRICRRQKT